LSYLRIFEGTCGNIILSVQINGFQWGWKYCYDDTFYTKYLNNPVRVGYKSTISLLGSGFSKNRSAEWNLKNDTLYETITLEYDALNEHIIKDKDFIDVKGTEKHRWKWDIFSTEDQDTTMEIYFCRLWLKNTGNIENELNNKALNKKWQHGYWITSQGLDPNSLIYKETYNKELDVITDVMIKDPLRLLRASNALVLPTRSNVRLMACSDDITHSWAVPALGLKMDCVPGRVFSIYLNIIREGIYFGQCSELCGWNHYNMPIVVYALPTEHFVIWWELELHTLFNKKSTSNTLGLNKTYSLINFKYK
jgi:heme/copper-type cytochrome/quinol oxidase subunit 2